jgi:cyclopropane-fatty-acyl-phospholipid synthase
VRALGFDERFLRMWEFYLASCEAAFASRYLGDLQLLMRRPTPYARRLGAA